MPQPTPPNSFSPCHHLQGAECYVYPNCWSGEGHIRALPLVQGGAVSGWTAGREALRQQLGGEERGWARALLMLILLCNTWWSIVGVTVTD